MYGHQNAIYDKAFSDYFGAPSRRRANQASRKSEDNSIAPQRRRGIAESDLLGGSQLCALTWTPSGSEVNGRAADTRWRPMKYHLNYNFVWLYFDKFYWGCFSASNLRSSRS